VSDKFVEKLANLGILNTSCELSEIKDKKKAQKSDGKMTQTIRGITKLIDAHNAGTKKSSQCRLILCEGDSAKALAVSGLQVVGRDQYGVFPLKGKLLNVRDAPEHQILKNEEI
jgi:DNA topoisomerase-2